MTLAPLLLSLQVAFIATLLTGVIGVALAAGIARWQSRWREWLDALFMLPLVLPPTVLGYYLIVLVGRNGAFGQWLEQTWGVVLIFSWQGAVLAASIVSLPLIYRTARAAFEEVNVSLENAGRSLGLSEWQVFWRISLPLAWRGIVAGLMLTFARAMGEFGATLMVAGNLPGKTQTLSVAVYDAVQAGNDAQAWGLTAIISVVCMAVLIISGQLLRPARMRIVEKNR
ncbi:MAG: molybdate ABC transporter permease subunit [Burkholderiales bacterium]|jgi:molybdate transport system permease protein|nr:molybdate ABC transporter permease subunit [Burkholderiales bacterium]MCA3154954.1 molybdate ABC transporter permease subunit [Burkholderiales bacterium]MCA3155955.1 molybdate ABC transporter permease subunit [Burkholderiales bacterium]MCA3159087.1 molybdate ABC transporter permease subunit [Burkholderiales bacterium]MCA3161869.1 molybdate ABC transporter permease subunit [Burkholderiales bacterium]